MVCGAGLSLPRRRGRRRRGCARCLFGARRRGHDLRRPRILLRTPTTPSGSPTAWSPCRTATSSTTPAWRSRLFWMAESPSEDPMDAWGHMGSVRIDGVPSPGCDGNLAGGWGNSGATVASKWWSSGATVHRCTARTTSAGMGGVCIAFAMTHGRRAQRTLRLHAGRCPLGVVLAAHQTVQIHRVPCRSDRPY